MNFSPDKLLTPLRYKYYLDNDDDIIVLLSDSVFYSEKCNICNVTTGRYSSIYTSTVQCIHSIVYSCFLCLHNTTSVVSCYTFHHRRHRRRLIIPLIVFCMHAMLLSAHQDINEIDYTHVDDTVLVMSGVWSVTSTIVTDMNAERTTMEK